MTTINIQRYAASPCVTLEGIPSDFFVWAEAAHGWNQQALLQIGQAAYGKHGNALDELVQVYLRLKAVKTQCCSCGVDQAPHSFYGDLLAYCQTCLPYADADVANIRNDDARTAAGLG